MSHTPEIRSISKSVALLLAFSCEGEAAGRACPTPATRPDVIRSALPTQPRALKPYSITQSVANYYDAPLGLGFLEVFEKNNQHYYDWMFELALPVWYTPDEARPLGWLSQGQLYADTGVEKLTGAGMVETEYEHTSFIVWETQGAWVKLRLTDDLYAWAHRCHLAATKFRLEFVPWQTFFRRHADWLHFPKPVPHILRTSPGIESKRVTTIGLDHKLMLLDIRGNWMEVEVRQPDLTCTGPDWDKARAIQHRGWVKWRDDRGPWVYVYTRGC